MLLDIQKLISYYMLEVINYSACRGMAGREFLCKGKFNSWFVQLPQLKKKNLWEDREKINSNFGFWTHGQMVYF